MKLLSCFKLSSVLKLSFGGGSAKGLLIGAPCFCKCWNKVSQEWGLFLCCDHLNLYQYAQAATSILNLIRFNIRSSTFGERAKLGPRASNDCSCSVISTCIAVMRSFFFV